LPLVLLIPSRLLLLPVRLLLLPPRALEVLRVVIAVRREIVFGSRVKRSDIFGVELKGVRWS